jgi:hypothetical protein
LRTHTIGVFAIGVLRVRPRHRHSLTQRALMSNTQIAIVMYVHIMKKPLWTADKKTIQRTQHISHSESDTTIISVYSKRSESSPSERSLRNSRSATVNRLVVRNAITCFHLNRISGSSTRIIANMRKRLRLCLNRKEQRSQPRPSLTQPTHMRCGRQAMEQDTILENLQSIKILSQNGYKLKCVCICVCEFVCV